MTRVSITAEGFAGMCCNKSEALDTDKAMVRLA